MKSYFHYLLLVACAQNLCIEQNRQSELGVEIEKELIKIIIRNLNLAFFMC